jgi:DNA modification methylase
MITILNEDCETALSKIDEKSINCCVTSPPYYGLRDYGMAGQIGLEQTPEEYVAKMVDVFRGVKRVLRDDGTLWLNLGDSYYNYRPGKGQSIVKQTVANIIQDLPQTCARRGNKLEGLKEKDLIGIPWRVAFALQADGWFLRQDIIWHKPNPMPESVKDRCTKAHEYIFLLSKSKNYYFDQKAIDEPAIYAGNKRGDRKDSRRGTICNSMNSNTGERRNKRSVWSVTTKGLKEAHFATFPPDLIEPCILAGCPSGGTVLDPFFGSGTTGLVARDNNRQCVGIELNPDYVEIANHRLFDNYQEKIHFND